MAQGLVTVWSTFLILSCGEEEFKVMVNVNGTCVWHLLSSVVRSVTVVGATLQGPEPASSQAAFLSSKWSKNLSFKECLAGPWAGTRDYYG